MRYVFLAASFLIAFTALTAPVGAEVTTFPVLPSVTDPEISAFNEPHWVYVDRDIVVSHKEGMAQDRHELLLWLPATGGRGHDAQAFSYLAAELGYHVVTLVYPDDVPATTCARDNDPTTFETFRMSIIQGGNALIRGGRNRFSVSRTDSIENRVVKLLQTLQKLRPREEWAQFLAEDGSLKWPSIAVAGQSQGGGHAALIGIKHPVARVLCFGAPKDYSQRYNAPAAWYGEASATAKSRFLAFNHRQDPMGCTPAQQFRNLQALQLDALGAPADVDTEVFPYRHTRILHTGYPTVAVMGQESEGARTAHGSGINGRNAERWKQVWTYMLTEQAP